MKLAAHGLLAILILLSAQPAYSHNVETLDWFGRKIIIAKVPKRVVSLSKNTTEMLILVGAEKLIVGISEDSPAPKSSSPARIVQKEGAFNSQAIRALSPDIIIASRKSPGLNLGEDLMAKTYFVNPRTLNEVMRAVVEVGRITALEKEATAAAMALNEQMEHIEKRISGAKKKSAVIITDEEDLVCAGDKSIEGDILMRAGGRNVLKGTEYGSLSVEDISSMKPEVIIFTGGPGFDRELLLTKLRGKNAAWSPAVISINPERLSRPGLKLVEGFEEMARALHPEAFRK